MFLEVQISAKKFLEYFQSEVSRLIPVVSPITTNLNGTPVVYFIDHVTVGTPRFERGADSLQIIQPLTLLLVPRPFVSSQVEPPTQNASDVSFEMIFNVGVGFANTTPQLEVGYTGNIRAVTVGEPLNAFIPLVPDLDVPGEIKKKLESLGALKVTQPIKIDDSTAALLKLPEVEANQILVDVDNAVTTFAIRLFFPPTGPPTDAFGTGDFQSFIADGQHDFAAVVGAENIINAANAEIQQTFDSQQIVLDNDALGPSWTGADDHLKLRYQVNVIKKDGCEDFFGIDRDVSLTLTIEITLSFVGDNMVRQVTFNDHTVSPWSWVKCATMYLNPYLALKSLFHEDGDGTPPANCTDIDKHTQSCDKTISAPHILGTLRFQKLHGTDSSAVFLGKLDLGALVSVPTVTALDANNFHNVVTGNCQHQNFQVRPQSAVLIGTGPSTPGTVPAPVQVGDIMLQTANGDYLPADDDDYSINARVVSTTEVDVSLLYVGNTPPEKNLLAIVATNAGVRKVKLGQITLLDPLKQVELVGKAKADCVLSSSKYHGRYGAFDPHWIPDPPSEFGGDRFHLDDGRTLWEVQVTGETPDVRLRLEREDGALLSEATVDSRGLAILSGFTQGIDYGSGIRIKNLDSGRVQATGSLTLTRIHLLQLGTIDLKENVRSIELYHDGGGLGLRAFHEQGITFVSLQRADRPVRLYRSARPIAMRRNGEHANGFSGKRAEIVLSRGLTAGIYADRIELMGAKTDSEFLLKQGERVFKTASASIGTSLYVRRSDGGGTHLQAHENGIEAITQFPFDPWFMLAQWHGDMLVTSNHAGHVSVFRAVSQRRETFPQSHLPAKKARVSGNFLLKLWLALLNWLARLFGLAGKRH